MFSKFFAHKTNPQPQSAPTGDAMKLEFLHAAHARALQTRVKSTGFQGSFANAPGFQCQTMPDGMEIAVNETHRFNAIMAENIVSMCGVGYSAGHWCLAHLSVFCRHALGAEPDWQPWQNGLAGAVPIADGIDIAFRCENSAEIDYNFSGQTHAGAILILEVKSRDH